MNGPTSSVSLSPLSSLCLLISFTNLYPLSLTSLFNHFFAHSPFTSRHCLPLRLNPGRSIKPHHATPHEPDPHSQIAVHQHRHTNPTHHIHSNPWPDCHAAELAMPSTMSSKPLTIGFLSIDLQWWVLFLSLFNLGCGFV